MKNIIGFIKKDIVLFVAVVLAIVSGFIVLPDKQYISYIDFRSIVILFVLMVVVAGIQELGLFHKLAAKLLSRTKKLYQIVLVLVLLCFFFGMLITNDVALITFVPLSFIVLDMLGKELKTSVITTVVCMQTIAANMGSMLTPLGNPQNLYLYSLSKISFLKFMYVMLPYTSASLVILIIWVLLYCCIGRGKGNIQITIEEKERTVDKFKLLIYAILFFVSMLSVLNVLDYRICFLIVFVAIFVMDRKVLKKVDYSLLFTFVAFFVFIGNIGRIKVFSDFIRSVVDGREIITSVLVSQVTSNVPAAILLSEFTHEYTKLMIGVNIGGLGTLIASMASLISYKILVKEVPEKRGKYILVFSEAGIVFLVILLGLYKAIS